jgi:hypothetical protein
LIARRFAHERHAAAAASSEVTQRLGRGHSRGADCAVVVLVRFVSRRWSISRRRPALTVILLLRIALELGRLDLAVFEGASSGPLDESDREDAGGVLEPGSSAGILVYENVWAAPFATALRRGGAQMVASGRIPVQALLAALDAAEARNGSEPASPSET